MPLDKKSSKRVDKLFSDLVQIATLREPATDCAEPNAAQPVKDESGLYREISALNARIRDLEMRLKESERHAAMPAKTDASILYEKEEVGYYYEDNNLLPLPTTAFAGSKTDTGISAPLTASGQLIGEMQIEPPTDHAWTAEEKNLANAIAQQASLQIQNLRLLAATERARTEAQDATRRFTHENWENFLDGIHHNERIGFVYDQSAVDEYNNAAPNEHDLHEAVNVLDEHVGNLFLKANPVRPLTEEDRNMVSAVARQLGQQVENLRLLADASRARADAEEANRRLTRENWQAYTSQNPDSMGFMYDTVQVTPFENTQFPQKLSFSQPLTVRGETIGQLAVAGLKDVSPGALELANNIAEQVSVHIENLRLFELNEKRAHELETVAVVSTTASTVLNPEELLQSVVDLTKERFNIYHTHIYLFDDAWNTLLLAAGAGEVGRKMVAAGHDIQMDEKKSLVARAARERTAVIVNDVQIEEDFLPNPFLPETRSEMALPMISGDKVIGVFDVQSDLAGHFTQEDANIYTTLASQVAVALQNARLYVEQSATVTQLRELDRLKSSFLANMSHELRTPLNSILGFSDVMLEGLDGDLTENMSNDLGLIQKNGKHLLHLINDVLDMAKIESGKMNLLLEKFKVHEIIDEVVSITSTLASEKNLALFMESDSDEEVEVSADRTRLRQVMINVVNNAIKFTEHGKISIRAIPQHDHVLITVRDTGIGIPPDKLEAVFQEFTQVDTSSTRKAGGTGLGLPISRKLVEMHGGRLWAESNGINGEGSIFFVELPYEAKLSEPEEKTSK
ncbi:MAG: GAF domain-containing sensor histidine kinase [Chloroflexi bacterium]|nr:GAF domain-containing sensor histidine kinase [Chloroflexota bacterium]